MALFGMWIALGIIYYTEITHGGNGGDSFIMLIIAIFLTILKT